MRELVSSTCPVLVTGGAGYIGSHAVLALIDAGWPVVVIDDLSTGFAEQVPAEATFVQGDVGDQRLVGELIERHAIGAIMHFAGSIIVPESVENPLKYYHNNTVRSRALIETAIQAGVPHFIFSSTAAVYGAPRQSRVAETDQTVPASPYGWSKLMTEQMLADVSRAHPLNYCALRYFNVAGADPNGRSGQSSRSATHLVKIAVEVATGKRDLVSIYGDDYPTPDGTGVRDYIHVSDLADAHVHALAYLLEHPSTSQVMNCGYGRGFSVMEVIDGVERVSQRTIARRTSLRRAGDVPELVADNSRIMTTLPWRPQRADLDTIIADALAWEIRLSTRSTEPCIP